MQRRASYKEKSIRWETGRPACTARNARGAHKFASLQTVVDNLPKGWSAGKFKEVKEQAQAPSGKFVRPDTQS